MYVPRQRDDDEISLISMRELAPSPIEDDSFYHASDAQIPPGAASPKESSTFFPSPPSHRELTFWLTRTQKYSSYAFLSFLGVHASTAALTPLFLGVESGNSSLLLARTYFYQASPYVELLLIPGALCTHVASGLSLRLYRYFKQWQRYGSRPPKSVDVWRWHNFSGVSRAGWLAIPAVVAHGVLMRVVPLAVDGDSSEIGLEYLAYGFWRGNWGKWIGGVFYTGFVGVVSYHVVCGWASYLKVHPRRRNMVLGAAATWAAVWLAGLGRVVAGSGKVGGYMGRHYEQLYRIFFRRL